MRFDPCLSLPPQDPAGAPGDVVQKFVTDMILPLAIKLGERRWMDKFRRCFRSKARGPGDVPDLISKRHQSGHFAGHRLKGAGRRKENDGSSRSSIDRCGAHAQWLDCLCVHMLQDKAIGCRPGRRRRRR